MKTINLNNYCSTKEVAERLKVTTARVSQLMTGGILKGTRIGNAWLVEKSSVANYVKALKVIRPNPNA